MYYYYFLLCSENGSPLGLYGVVNGTVSLASSNSLVSRTLSYTVVRRDGVDISSALLIQHSYQVRHSTRAMAGKWAPGFGTHVSCIRFYCQWNILSLA